MNKFEMIAQDEQEQKEKLEKGNLAIYSKFDKYSFEKNIDAETYMLLTLIAPEMKTTDKRKTLNLTACLDVSGSMRGEKLDNVKKTMKKLIQHLTDDDILGIVAFESAVAEVLKPVKMTSTNKDLAIKVVNQLNDAGGTNLSGGLFKAIESVKSNTNDINRILLFTDGEANEGVQEPNQLKTFVKEQVYDKASISCFGFGATYNADLLTDISTTFNGNLYHIQQAEDIATSFAKELGGLLSVFAQNIEVEVKLESGVEMIHDYNHEFVDSGSISGEKDKAPKNFTFKINDIYSQESRNLLFKLKVEKGTTQKNVAQITVKYLDLIKNKVVEDSKTSSIVFVDKDNADKDIDKKVALQIAIFESAKAQTEAINFAKNGNYIRARSVIQDSFTHVNNMGINDVQGVNAIMSELQGTVSFYDNDMSYTASANSANAMRASYSKGRVSTKIAAAFSSLVADNAIVSSTLDSFAKEDKEEK